uniref:Glycosyltransferase n=1 Tax=viral metagenome TaxID=1070528 RepID=A0A6M3J951_9ZZZZ
MDREHQKIFIGICNSQKEVPASFFWSFINIDCPYKIEVSRSTHPWDVVRNNNLIKSFLESQNDIFVKMDIDQEYPKDYFLEMIPLVKKYKVVSPLIFDRWQQNRFMPLAFNKYSTNGYGWEKWDINGKTGIHEVPYTHTNNFYSREVLEKISPPWYEAFLSDDGLNRRNHVDYTFLDKLKSSGYPIYLNLDVVVKHDGIGREEYARENRDN